MADTFEKTINNTQKEIFESFNYVDVKSDFDKKWALVSIYKNKKFFDWDLSKIDFEDYINSLDLEWKEIKSTKYENNKFFIKFEDDSEFSFDKENIKNKKVEKILWKDTLEKTEKKSKLIYLAMNAIFKDKEWYIWDDDISDKDVFIVAIVENLKDISYEDKNFLLTLNWKNLKQLKKFYESENEKLVRAYKILNKTKSKISTLQEELEISVWIWELYETWAKIFRMKSKEIEKKVFLMLENMSEENTFAYIKEIHLKIENNWDKSDMTSQVNKKYIDALYKITFQKLKNNNSSNSSFIEFAKILTWRWKLELEKVDEYKNKQEFEYGDLEMDWEFKAIDVANRALIYVMLREDWVIEKLKKEKELEYEKISDPALKWRSPAELITETKAFFSKTSNVEEVFNKIGFEKYLNINRKYEELSFDEKIEIWTIARILDTVKEIKTEEIVKPWFFKQRLNEIALRETKESYETVNDIFSDNFDWFHWFLWLNASDINLHWELAEIFELYQDINWNGRIFDFSDENVFSPSLSWTIIAWVTMLTAAMALSLLAPAWVSYLTALWVSEILASYIASAWAFAVAWWATWAVTILSSRKWYDTQEEFWSDFRKTVWADAKVWAAFWMASFTFFKNLWFISKWKFENIDILKHDFLKKATLADLWIFWISEMLYNSIIVSPWIIVENRKKFPENHFDTDNIKYENNWLL